ncbi:ECU08_0495 [Encephalitozoon cuniculi GB-M1]|uniref:ECU08_0495 protein n=1 Tax=Encephalitozoon cuniculi (strain GB-M1) TaxID=284813 RepID=I7KFY1_ENCCU|nr:uncharacterized protein ECU08_0495 [Encephalitozoon cuniculi GB-M1]CCI73963.1 ECU08_0495 [Encephalitozoon cuniculi GB-M1]
MTKGESERKCFRVFCTSEKEEMAKKINQAVDEEATLSKMQQILKKYSGGRD